jgi:hypothetical protein
MFGHVYNIWPHVVVQQARFPARGTEKKLDFGKKLSIKYGTYAQHENS